jgi:DNA-binding helix-hairpin-helix protein with protein kinase domain
MRNFWLVLLISATLATAGLLSSASRSTSAEDAVDRSQVALILDGVPDRSPPAKPPLYYVKHDLCGIGLGGYCPGRYRSCIRAGRPKAECEAWVARCDACNQAMLECRQKVGHQPGYSCVKCRKKLDKCRASLSAPVK